MCHHLSSGSNQGYLSSCLGTFMSSVVTSVQVEICGIFAGSIGLSCAIGLGLRVTGVTLSCRYWSIGKCFKLLIWTRPFDLHQNTQPLDRTGIQWYCLMYYKPLNNICYFQIQSQLFSRVMSNQVV